MNFDFNVFLDRYSKIEQKYAYKEPWIGLVGKNYLNGSTTSIKVYYQIYNKILKNEYPFDKNYDLYNEFFNYIDRERCANNGIALKYNLHSKQYNSYFHIKFNSLFNFEEDDIFISLPLRKFKKAVSVEFNSDTDIRRYYYIDNFKDMEFILSFFKFKEDANKLKYIEYTHNPKKIILIYKDKIDICQSLSVNCCNDIKNNVEFINQKYNTVPSLIGKYFNSNKYSIYWDIYRKNNFINDFLSAN
jgi:hypothetical protein